MTAAFRLFGVVGTMNPVGLVATVFPEFIARDGQESADGAVKERTRGSCGLQVQPRTRPCAPWRHKAAGFSREQGGGGRTDGWTGNGRRCVPTGRQAKRAGPDMEAGLEKSAELSEGTMEVRMGRDAAGGSMRSTTASPG